MIASIHSVDDLALYTDHFGGRAKRSGTTCPMIPHNEFTALHSAFELHPRLDVGDLAHSTAEHRFDDGPFIAHG